MGIGYKVGGEFQDLWDDETWIAFDIVFPRIYDTQEAAESIGSRLIKAVMEKRAEQEVVIQLYEGGSLVDTIRWDEWWKYKCYRTKESSKGKLWQSREDFEPCSEKFETIFDGYTRGRCEVIGFEMQYLAYWIEPAIVA